MKSGNYWSPYLTGAGIGATLLSSFVVAGRGVGASRAFTVVAGTGMKDVFPKYTGTLDYLTKYVIQSPLKDWTVLLVCGVLIGALAGVIWGGLFRVQIDRPASMRVATRLISAFGGGVMLGFASRLARGCTSGVGLTGGSQLALSGWIFVIAMFASGFLFALFFRRFWS